MAHEYLSEPWFAAVEELGPPPPPSGPDPGPINVVVTRSDGDDVELHFSGGAMSRGLLDEAPTTLTTTYDVAKALFIKRDQQAAMQAFMSGQIKVDGDMSKLMAMGNATPTPEQEAYTQKIVDLTEA
ncbi:MAG TPA: SCP2 sterol-binding domain-containing protein [Acidimicrobiales bacterium]|nr:SCP2 sterol-binding domain-containing protein [Acidimicrobiales bacterium]